MSFFFEDLVIGDRQELGSHIFTAQEIKTFAAAYDPQDFHLDEEAGARSHFGGLCASGWHTAAMWMAQMVAYRKRMAEKMEAAGETLPHLGPSPGFRDLRWLKPVYAGDTITYSCTLTGKRATASRPGWGLVTHHNEGVNQHGQVVFSFAGCVFWPMRPAA